MCNIKPGDLERARAVNTNVLDTLASLEDALGQSLSVTDDVATVGEFLADLDAPSASAPAPQRSLESRIASLLRPGESFKTFYRPAYAMWQTEIFNANNTLKLSVYGPTFEASRAYAAQALEAEWAG